MKRLTIAVVAVALLWAGFWAFSAWQLRQATESWFADRRADGWGADYADLTVRGFPNRLDRSFADIVLADPQARVVWEAPFFQVFQLTYKPGHIIAAWPDSHSLTTPDGRWQITGDTQRASLVHAGGALLRANLEAETLNLARDDGTALALAGLTASLQHLEGTTADYRLALVAQALAFGDTSLSAANLPDSVNGLQADVTLRLDAPLAGATLSRARPQPTRLDIRLAEYRYGGLELKLAGSLDISPSGTPEGQVTVKAVNWRALLDQARASGALPGGLADALEDGLGLLAGLRGNSQTLDLPLNFTGGRVMLGPIPLGRAPVIRVP